MLTHFVKTVPNIATQYSFQILSKQLSQNLLQLTSKTTAKSFRQAQGIYKKLWGIKRDDIKHF